VTKPYDVICKAQDRELWLKERNKGIGASDIAAVLGISPWSTPLKLWGEKTGMVPADEDNVSEAMEWGNRLEPLVADKFEEETEREVYGGGVLIRSKEHPWMMATLDREQESTEHDSVGNLEIKTGSLSFEDKWSEGPPEYYYCQFQQQLAVTGHSWGSVAVLLGGRKFLWCDVERDEEKIGEIVEAGSKFWDLVTKEIAPMATADDKETLKLLFPEENDQSIALEFDAIQWDEELEDIKSRLKFLNAKKSTIENQFKQAIGENLFGLLPDGTSYSLKTTSVKESVVKRNAYSYRSLRRKAPR